MRLSRLIQTVAAIVAFLAVCGAAPAQSPWQQPASDLAAQIASILGRGTARLMIRDLSSLSVDEIPAIRRLLEQDLRARGIVANSAPNDTIIRVTLSENAHGLTWVAEVIQGDDTQVAVVDLPLSENSQLPAPAQFMLRREALITSTEPVLGAIDPPGLLILLTPNGIVVNTRTPGWTLLRATPIPARLPLSRDPRGMILPEAQGAGFEAWLAGSHCTGSPAQAPASGFTINCHPSDDPWPLSAEAVAIAPQPSGPIPNLPPNPLPSAQTVEPNAPPSQVATNTPMPAPAPQIHAFYSATRNYFTGVVSPSVGVDLPPFYSAGVLPRTSGTALLISTIDGRVLIASSGKLSAVSGTTEWGSDFASIHSGCGTGNQIVAAGQGNETPANPPTDTLRVFQITGSDAEPVSSPLAIDGTVTALWTAPDAKSVLAVIRTPQNQYEVDRVTALCN